MVNFPDGYYNRFLPTKNYDDVVFRAGRVLQSAELNEIQAGISHRMTGLSDVLFAEGSVIENAQAIVDPDTGATELEAGFVYVRGAVRPVAEASFTIPIDRVVALGVYLTETIVTELEDPALLDPAVGTRNYNQGGSARLRRTLAWGWDNDGQVGEFFAVHQVEHGVLLGNDPPPQLDGVNIALARYDRAATGGDYVVEGLLTRYMYDDAGDMVFSLDEGRAHVRGFEVVRPTAGRLRFPVDPDPQNINAEPHIYIDSGGSGRIDLNHTPINTINSVIVTKRKTVTLTHGSYSGVADALPDTSVSQIISVTQASTTYVSGTDYKLTADTVDWSLGGAEPATGSTYSVTYDYLTEVTPDTQDQTGFTVSGVVNNTQVLTDYSWNMPRRDLVVLDQDGVAKRVKGISRPWSPVEPTAPAGTLMLATLSMTWDEDPSVDNNHVRTIPFSDLEHMRDAITDLYILVAGERLRGNITAREPAAQRGVFVDPFFDDDLRDQGIAQTAAVVDGELMLPIAGDPKAPPNGQETRITLDYTLEPVLDQPLRTKSMKVNPYQSFAIMPAKVTLISSVDRWTQVNSSWSSDSTTRFIRRGHFVPNVSTVTNRTESTSVTLVGRSVREAEFLRQVTVRFHVDGFGPGEVLDRLLFDGISISPNPW